MGIIAKVSSRCHEFNVNILDITQKVFSDTFAMIMMVDINTVSPSFHAFADNLTALGEKMGLSIHTVHEDIYNSMHRI